MATEIEHKFLVKNDIYKQVSHFVRISQGYICSEVDRVVRVRIYGKKAYLTIKNASVGYARNEFEYEIPMADAEFLLGEMCIQPIIEKNRYTIEFGSFKWEIDEFLGDSQGLVIAEIELPTEDTEFYKPSFIGEEVTGNPLYYNSNITKNPYKNWKE